MSVGWKEVMSVGVNGEEVGSLVNSESVELMERHEGRWGSGREAWKSEGRAGVVVCFG